MKYAIEHMGGQGKFLEHLSCQESSIREEIVVPSIYENSMVHLMICLEEIQDARSIDYKENGKSQ